MKNLKQIISEDNLTISRSTTQSSTAEGEYTTQIPVDLLIDIFLRVPSSSIARFRFVSKSWASILGRSYFTELFLSKSLNHPRLLFIARHGGKLFFFSSPQTHNPDNEKLSLVVSRYRTYSLDRNHVSLLHGKLCCQDIYSAYTTPVIYNPVTGDSLTLPKVKLVLSSQTSNYFGFDPIDKQYKVLSVTSSPTSKISLAQVMTLETGKCLWRTIECKPHYPMPSHRICIDGVLYYRGSADFQFTDSIVCFDVRSEKFRFINIDDEKITRASVLINYKGKLGGVHFIRDTSQIRLRLWWLEVDAGKNKWSSNIYELPLSWKNPYTNNSYFDIVGMTGTCEIVLSPYFYSNPFYVFYYNIERKTLARVEIQGLQEFKNERVCTYPDYVEDVKLMKSL